ncbi:MAG TPA: hypothetical protein VKP04_02505, partial [Ktedonobacteraceae bacterium]|nr:hypothetical protein [Ktedonobacteraceae bacterium]
YMWQLQSSMNLLYPIAKHYHLTIIHERNKPCQVSTVSSILANMAETTFFFGAMKGDAVNDEGED